METGDWPAVFDVPYCLEDYGFEVLPPVCPHSPEGKSQRITKSIKYVYSELLDRTYIKRTAPIPFLIRTKVPPPQGSMIRVQCVFKDSVQKQSVIQRCSKHLADDHHDEHCAPNHLIRADTKAMYLQSPQTGHLQILIPFPPSQTDLSTMETFYFVCGTSCFYGKRIIQVSFTLEDSTGYPLGTSLLDVHICASPGRDKEKHEAALTAKKGREKARQKRQADVDADNKTPQCKRREDNAELLERVKRGLDLDYCVPEHLKDFYLSHKDSDEALVKNAATQTEVRLVLRRILVRVMPPA